MKRKVDTRVYYDLGLFGCSCRNVEKCLDSPFSFLTSIKNDVHITINDNGNRLITSAFVWHDFITAKGLLKYCSRAKEIYKPKFDNKEGARNYYEEYLSALDDGDLYSLIEKDEDYATFLLMYLLMLKDGVLSKG